MILSETLDQECMSRRKPLEALTSKQLRFIDEYFEDLNATQAAIRAGYSPKTAAVIGCENLIKPNIAGEIARRRQALAKKFAVSRERCLKELACSAFLDPGKMFDNHGNPLEIAEMPQHVRRAIASFEFYEDLEGKGEYRRAVGYTKKFKFVDKLHALKQLMETLGYAEPQAGEEVPGNGPRSIRVVFVNGPTKKDVNLPPKVVKPSYPHVTFVGNHGEH